MSEYIRSGKSIEYLGEWINLSINIRIYLISEHLLHTGLFVYLCHQNTPTSKWWKTFWSKIALLILLCRQVLVSYSYTAWCSWHGWVWLDFPKKGVGFFCWKKWRSWDFYAMCVCDALPQALFFQKKWRSWVFYALCVCDALPQALFFSEKWRSLFFCNML